MAEPTSVTAYHHGDMPVADHTSTYLGVMGLFKWGALGTADLLIFLTLAFCTPAGVFPSLVIAVIVLIVGIVALRARKSPAAH